MKNLIRSYALCLILLPGFASTAMAQTKYEVYFSPDGGCTEVIARNIRQARLSILVQAYNFTSTPIASALRDAHRRGVKVEVLLDRSQRTDKYSVADFLVNSGVPTRIDAEHAIAHNKVIVIDGGIVITGSFNFTSAAEERNAENVLIVHDRVLADKYADNWREHARHSEKYAGKSKIERGRKL